MPEKFRHCNVSDSTEPTMGAENIGLPLILCTTASGRTLLRGRRPLNHSPFMSKRKRWCSVTASRHSWTNGLTIRCSWPEDWRPKRPGWGAARSSKLVEFSTIHEMISTTWQIRLTRRGITSLQESSTKLMKQGLFVWCCGMPLRRYSFGWGRTQCATNRRNSHTFGRDIDLDIREGMYATRAFVSELVCMVYTTVRWQSTSCVS